ncbi:DUF1015 domain-containing protein [Carbonactinospora thermoautotrophica]|nr:DUF1015 domain-containing protein [Carbonactinospora thermoautotrophica]
MPRMTVERTSAAAPAPHNLVLAPFRGVRFNPARVRDLGAVTTPPYDIIDADGVGLLEHSDPHNLVRLILPRDGAERYARAARALDRWLAEEVLVTDPEPALYVYEQAIDGRAHRGLIGALGLCPFEAGVILPHEDVMPGPVADRLELMRATRANLEPILLAYEGGGAASDETSAVDTRQPLVDVETSDGSRHRLWAITDPAALARIAADLAPRQALIADGHHRYATYQRLQAEQHAAGRGPGPWDFGLALLVDTTRWPLEVRGMHRVVPALAAEDAVRLASKAFRVTRLEGDLDAALRAQGEARERGPALLVSDGRRHWLLTDPDPAAVEAAVPRDRPRAWRWLEATILHAVLLDRLWHVPDTTEHIQYRHVAPAAVAEAAATGGTAVLLNAVPESTVRDLAAAGVRMPRKSTSFHPKPRSGFVLRTFEADHS